MLSGDGHFEKLVNVVAKRSGASIESINLSALLLEGRILDVLISAKIRALRELFLQNCVKATFSLAIDLFTLCPALQSLNLDAFGSSVGAFSGADRCLLLTSLLRCG